MRDNSRDLWPMAIMAASAAVIMIAARGFPNRWDITDGEWLGFFGSVLGGLFTVLAAYIAWRSVRPQIVEAQRQSAANAKMALMHQPVDFGDELTNLNETNAIVRRIRHVINWYREELNTKVTQIADATDDCLIKLVLFEKYIDRTAVMYPPFDPTHSSRQELEIKIRTLSSLLVLLRVHVDALRGRRDIEDVIGRDLAYILLDNIEEALRDFMAARNKHGLGVTEQLREVWKRIRNLEAIAIAHHSAASTVAESGPKSCDLPSAQSNQ